MATESYGPWNGAHMDCFWQQGVENANSGWQPEKLYDPINKHHIQH